MKGFAATFWMAIGGLCQAFSAFALQRSIWWSSHAAGCFEKARLGLIRRGQGRARR